MKLRKKSTRSQITDEAYAQLTAVKERVAPAVDVALDKAGIALDKATTARDVAREKAGPAVASALSTAATTAAPYAATARDKAVHGLEVAREKATPVAESARDKAVDDYLPRLAEGVAALSAAALAARDSAVDKASDTTGYVLPGTKKRRRRSKIKTVATFAIAGAVLAGLAAWLRNRQKDPWQAAGSTPAYTPPASTPNGAVTTSTPATAPVAPVTPATVTPIDTGAVGEDDLPPTEGLGTDEVTEQTTNGSTQN